MNRRGKVLSVLILLTFLACWCTLDALATEGGVTSWKELSSIPPLGSSPPESSLVSSGTSSGQSSSVPPPSSAPSSSKKPAKTRARVSSSSVPSSSEDSSCEFSSSSMASSAISLPSVGSVPENNPLSSVVNNTEASHRMNWIGILSWACIVLGIVVVLIVVLSNRRPPRGMGRRRYRRPKRTGKKRLLNDKYYRDINRY